MKEKTLRELEKLHSKIQDVPLAKMRVSPNAQRELKAYRVAFLRENFNIELLGYPVVNLREGVYWIIDGQHRIAALREWLDAWEGQSLTCRVYTSLTEKQEADMFDWLNNVLTVSAFDKFKTRVTAGREVERDVQKVVENCGLRVSVSHEPGSLSCVSTLVKIAQRGNPETLGRSLTITHSAFGDTGLTHAVIDGIARVCDRYNGQLKDDATIERLNTMRGGVGALLGRAEVLRKATRRATPECVAAAVIDVLNSKRGGKKLPSWWAVDEK